MTFTEMLHWAAVAQSVATWLGVQRVDGSSPATDHNMEVDWYVKRCQFTSLVTVEVPLSKVPNPPYAVPLLLAVYLCMLTICS